MPKNKPKILAIDHGTKEMGVAFLDGEKSSSTTGSR